MNLLPCVLISLQNENHFLMNEFIFRLFSKSKLGDRLQLDPISFIFISLSDNYVQQSYNIRDRKCQKIGGI